MSIGGFLIEEKKTVRICCHSCKELGYIIENKFPDKEKIKIVCPECNGKTYVEDVEYVENLGET